MPNWVTERYRSSRETTLRARSMRGSSRGAFCVSARVVLIFDERELGRDEEAVQSDEDGREEEPEHVEDGTLADLRGAVSSALHGDPAQLRSRDTAGTPGSPRSMKPYRARFPMTRTT